MLKEVMDKRRVYPQAVGGAYSAGRPHLDEERPPSREADRERNRQDGSPAADMLADAPEQEKHAWPKRNRKKVDRVVKAETEHARDNRTSEIEGVMIAERQARLSGGGGGVKPILQGRSGCRGGRLVPVV